jgi:hypothetical protein
MAMSVPFTSVVLVLAIVATACGPGERTPEGEAPRPSPSPSALVPEDELVEVLAPDSIPSIDDPRFVPPGQASWLAGQEPVISVELGPDARAYPVQILTFHEIVNDVVGGTPVAVTYCPLCNSAVVFRREAQGRLLEFGTSGKLYRSALVMYDRQTESLWTHFDGTAISGPLAGTRLELVPSQLLSFAQWRAEYPDGRVLSRDTGHQPPYGENPYAYYDSREEPHPSFFEPPEQGDLPALARVVGVSLPSGEVAYPYTSLAGPAGAGVIQDRERDLVVFWQDQVASALDAPEIAEGRDVGSSGVFVPRAGGRRLSFEVRGGEIADRETGSTWTLAGRAAAGPMEGARLESIAHLDSFWFAWFAYYPETDVYRSVDASRA